MKSVLDDWTSLAKDCELYRVDTRQLTGYWAGILASPYIEAVAVVNPKTLLYAAKASKLIGTLEGVHIDEPPETM